MKRNLINSPSFVRAAKKYIKKNPDRAGDFKTALEKLSINVFDPSLKTHKLLGILSGRWACSAGYDLRIIFRIVESDGKEDILLLTVGTPASLSAFLIKRVWYRRLACFYSFLKNRRDACTTL